ncbi:hypothetical protein [Microvirga lotononidis]|uniref:Uncharacterized protein n=1 Tax=Microvirga lotononidis TaxID=864069 RepID=I4Z3J7_9HYPH|nr:hypothetical protein [Microvirga lotononidis]EIM30789.1 hypothetical protein MicloDRAFT_00003160 [Microvirga lotononidis]WQO31738.1 hypothetical protein U0023_30725 [Microvirga lotononidis]
MPRYYFHLRSKERFVRDTEGGDKVAAELHGVLLHETRAGCCGTVAVTDEGDRIIHVTSH